MIERYTLPEMGQIWTESAKFHSWLKVEIAACEANCSLGKIPENAMKDIRSNAKFDESRIKEIEKEVKHDVIAFLTSVNEFVGDSGSCLLYTSPSPRDPKTSRMPSSA